VADQQQTRQVSPEEAAVEAASDGAGDPRTREEARAAERVEEDLDELRTRAAERDEYLALAQRTQADFENYRKRVARDAAVARDKGVKQVVSELLPALDNFERALAAAEAEEADEEHHLTKGIRLVQQELVAALGRVGIEPFSPKGEPFDPTQHEAMAQQPVEGAASGTVVEVLQAGYRLNGAVVRPARVMVAA
jgi:molecular chaperone GrpE